jgi:hypothetical protein
VRLIKNKDNNTKCTVELPFLTKHFDIIFIKPNTNLNKINIDKENEKLSLKEFTGVDLSFAEFEYATANTKKSDVMGDDGLSFNMIFNTSQSFRNVIISLQGLIFSTGIIPEPLNYTHIIPIIKDSKKPSDSLNNLRPISISNTVAHIFERILQLKMPNLKKTHKNQFGYMDKCSCSHALFAFKETILSYIENKKHCFVVTLDAVKAFDSVCFLSN